MLLAAVVSIEMRQSDFISRATTPTVQMQLQVRHRQSRDKMSPGVGTAVEVH
jgi:hypothetical protein